MALEMGTKNEMAIKGLHFRFSKASALHDTVNLGPYITRGRCLSTGPSKRFCPALAFLKNCAKNSAIYPPPPSCL